MYQRSVHAHYILISKLLYVHIWPMSYCDLCTLWTYVFLQSGFWGTLHFLLASIITLGFNIFSFEINENTCSTISPFGIDVSTTLSQHKLTISSPWKWVFYNAHKAPLVMMPLIIFVVQYLWNQWQHMFNNIAIWYLFQHGLITTQTYHKIPLKVSTSTIRKRIPL